MCKKLGNYTFINGELYGDDICCFSSTTGLFFWKFKTFFLKDSIYSNYFFLFCNVRFSLSSLILSVQTHCCSLVPHIAFNRIFGIWPLILFFTLKNWYGWMRVLFRILGYLLNSCEHLQLWSALICLFHLCCSLAILFRCISENDTCLDEQYQELFRVKPYLADEAL